MKKLAIVSSYKELCGIASYTAILEKEFKKHFEVEVIKLDTEILKSNKENLVKMGNKHINEIAEKIKEYYYVNIQFVASLFGSDFKLISERVSKIIRNSKNLIFTFHSINLNDIKLNKKKLLTRQIFNEINIVKNQKKIKKLYHSIISQISSENKQANKNLSIMVHTEDSRKEIQKTFEFNNVYDFPLSMLSKEERDIKITEENKLKFKEKYGYKKNDIILGIFGFVSMYKGHLAAINALELLPKNYKLLILGSQHPHTIQENIQINSYLNKLLEKINKSKSLGETNNEKMERLKFAGGINDEEYMEAMRCSDFILLPYVEVGQMASAVAAQVLESKSKGIFSNNKTFFELEKYFPNSFEKIDIGNYYELAEKILNNKKDYNDELEKNLKKYNLENNILNYKRIFELE